MICVQMVSVQHLNSSDYHYDYHLGEGLPHTMANLSQVPLLKRFQVICRIEAHVRRPNISLIFERSLLPEQAGIVCKDVVENT